MKSFLLMRLFRLNNLSKFLLIFTLLVLGSVFPQKVRAVSTSWTGGASSTAWGTAGNWSTNAVPTSSDDVTIGDLNSPSIKQPTLSSGTTVNSISIIGKSSNGNRGGCLTVATGVTLTITTNLTITGSTSGAGGSVSCGSVSKKNGLVTTTTGSVTVGGNITLTNASTAGGEQPQILLGSGGTLKIAGTVTLGTNATFTVTAGTVNYNGGAQTVAPQTYGSLLLSGSGTKTLTSVSTINSNLTLAGTASATTAANMTIGGNLFIRDGTTLTVGAFTLAVTGTTTVGEGMSGTLTFSSATNPGKTLTGVVTVNSGGTWTESAAITPTFNSGIVNNGTFTTSTGVHTFATNAQEIHGLHSIASVTVTGITVTNFDTLTIGTALAGTGGLTNSGTGTLNIGGTSTITTLTATSTGNTVNYTGASQTIHANNYHNLTLSGSGTDVLQAGTTAIGGNFTLTGTESVTAAAGLTIGGNVSIGSGTTFNGSTFTHNVAGNWSNAGTFTAATSTVIFNGGSQTVNNANTWYNLSITGTAARTVTFQSASLQTVSHNLTLTGTSGHLLTLKSSSTSVKWTVNAPSSQSINYTFASLSDASSGNAVNAGGGTGNINGGNNLNWDYGAGAPTLTNISPSSGSELGGTSITITGTNFAGGASVTVGGTSATSINVASSTSITATTPVGTVGTADIIVITSGGAGLSSGYSYLSHSAALDFTAGTGTSLAGVVLTNNTISQTGANEGTAKPLSASIANTNKSAAIFAPITTNATVTAYADNGTGGGSYASVAANYDFSGSNNTLWIKVVSQDTTVTTYYKLSVTVAGALSTDATLNRAASTVKGETPSTLGTANATLASAVAGAVTISYAESQDTSNTGSFITLFTPTNGGATTKVVKYASGDGTANFATVTAYANQMITDQDFFIVRVTAQDGTTILFYKVIVTVTPPPLSSDATLNATTTTIKGVTTSALGTPNSTLSSASGGSVILTSAQAADTSNTGSFITLFSPTNVGASIPQIVKYANGASTTNFLTDTTYANGAISNNDFFIVEVDAADGTVSYYKIVATVSASNDATLRTSSTVKGVTVTGLGTPNATLSSASGGSVSITSTQAADTSNTGSFVTLFNPTNAGATSKVVKYASGASTSGFATDTAYANQAISNNDFFIVKITAADSSTILYYKFSVTISSYTLTYVAGSHGSLTGSTSQSVNSGASGTAVTAVPATGYHFVNWSDASTSNPRTDASIVADLSVTANFAINTYTVAYAAGTHGSLTGTTSQTINYGASGTAVTAVPATGYHFVNWSDASTSNPRTDTVITQDLSFTANFAINTYTLSYSAGSHGSLTGTASQVVNYNASGTAVTPVPDSGYHFVNWSDASTSNPRTDTSVTQDVSVTANFSINTYTLSYTAGTHGSLTGTTPQTVNSGASGTAVTAVPASGYHFVNWSDASVQNPRTDISVSADHSVTANFGIDASSYTLTYTAGTHGSLTGTTPQTINSGADGSAVTAVPASGYHFVNWSDASSSNPRTDTTVGSNISVTANFAITTYSLSYTAGAHGSLTGTASQTVNSGASGSAVTAVPATGYHFVNWSDASTSNPRTDTNVIADHSVTANFAINTYTLSYTAGSHGSLTGTTSQTVNYDTNGTSITATGSAGFVFLQWSDGSTDNPRQDTGVIANISVSASFTNTRTLNNPTPTAIQGQVNGGFLGVGSGNAANTNNFTTNVDFTFKNGSNNKVVLPVGTVSTKKGGGNFDVTSFDITDNTSDSKNAVSTTLSSTKIGVPNIGLAFSQSITLTLPVDTSYNGQTLDVYSLADGATVWNYETTCLISGGNCSFQTDHATTFAVRASTTSNQGSGSSSNSGSSSGSTPPGCSLQKPSSAPDLFQVSTSPDSATLYFSPVNPVTQYVIGYGVGSNTDQFGATFAYGASSGVVSYTIHDLNPGTAYSFKVRGGNGCMPGDWSQVATAKTTSDTTSIGFSPLQNPLLKGTVEVVDQQETTQVSSLQECVYIVQKGDTLRKIAQKKSTHRQTIIDQNIEAFPSIASALTVGSQLHINCPPSTPVTKIDLKNIGYTLSVLLQNHGKPVVGAVVKLHSVPQQTTTDKDGIARFTDVEGGQHVLAFTTDGYQGQENITVDGDKKDITINVSVELKKNDWASKTTWIIVAVLGSVILFLLTALFLKLRKHRRTK
ncbi:MAG TPA: InlB B-repeat-containing protein [Candidatus Saccharimonadia bacterium]|nr:InlB B-repeat-containing protein [Candidatus Saccharimonadia bacterium]